jgi:hypothetical protein
MGRIVSSVTITNISDPSVSLRCDALVDTGASFMVLRNTRTDNRTWNCYSSLVVS